MLSLMDIVFEDRGLALIETEAAASTHLPIAVIHSARHRLAVLRAAPDIEAAKAWKSLGLQALPETATYLISLSPAWAMSIKITEKNASMTVIVKELEERLRGVA
jgi:proteic killer suppression protein